VTAAVEAAEEEKAALQAEAAALARRLGDVTEALARKVCAGEGADGKTGTGVCV